MYFLIFTGYFSPDFLKGSKTHPGEWRIILQFYNCRHFLLPWDWTLNFSSFDRLPTQNLFNGTGREWMFAFTPVIPVFIYSFLVISLIFIYRAGSYVDGLNNKVLFNLSPSITFSNGLENSAILAFEQWLEILVTWTLTLLHNDVWTTFSVCLEGIASSGNEVDRLRNYGMMTGLLVFCQDSVLSGPNERTLPDWRVGVADRSNW